YGKALEKEPEYAEAHLNLSYVYEKLNRTREAHAEYETACKLKSELCQFQPDKAQKLAIRALQLFEQIAGLGSKVAVRRLLQKDRELLEGISISVLLDIELNQSKVGIHQVRIFVQCDAEIFLGLDVASLLKHE